jgi:hypothetical protein
VTDQSLATSRLLVTYRISVSTLADHALTEIRRFQMAEKPPSTDNSTHSQSSNRLKKETVRPTRHAK